MLNIKQAHGERRALSEPHEHSNQRKRDNHTNRSCEREEHSHYQNGWQGAGETDAHHCTSFLLQAPSHASERADPTGSPGARQPGAKLFELSLQEHRGGQRGASRRNHQRWFHTVGLGSRARVQVKLFLPPKTTLLPSMYN